MTIRTTVVNKEGHAVQSAYVTAGVQETGAMFSRFTDGNGYADVALNAEIPDHAHVTFAVQADGYHTHLEYLTLDEADDDREVSVTLSPFA